MVGDRGGGFILVVVLSVGHWPVAQLGPVEFPPRTYEFRGRSKCESHPMGQTVHHYHIFETAAGFCGIAWANLGITRFQLPTSSGEATKRILLPRLPGSFSIDIGELLPVLVADNEASILLFNGPRRREAAGGHRRISASAARLTTIQSSDTP